MSEATSPTRYSYQITHWGKRERVIAKLKIVTYGVGAAGVGALATLASLGVF